LPIVAHWQPLQRNLLFRRHRSPAEVMGQQLDARSSSGRPHPAARWWAVRRYRGRRARLVAGPSKDSAKLTQLCALADYEVRPRIVPAIVDSLRNSTGEDSRSLVGCDQFPKGPLATASGRPAPPAAVASPACCRPRHQFTVAPSSQSLRRSPCPALPGSRFACDAVTPWRTPNVLKSGGIVRPGDLSAR
jgi:hypothetical protein